jgi:hypothetical protein
MQGNVTSTVDFVDFLLQKIARMGGGGDENAPKISHTLFEQC